MRLDISQLMKLNRKITETSKKVRRMTDETTKQYGEELLAATIRHASGRPGPNVVTGNYRSSFDLTFKDHRAIVSNPSEQAHRLEYGFVGVDALGRVYNQPPYPHFRPALREVRPRFAFAIAAIPLKAWRES